VREILSDLVAEQQSLDQFLQRVAIRDWDRPTPAAGWSIRDTVSHLATFEEYAYNALAEGGSRRSEADAYANDEEFTASGLPRGRAMRAQDVIEWWRGARAKVIEELSRSTPNKRVPWFKTDMSARTFATTRLMETWAHGLDVYASLDEECEDTIRLRHIAWLGWKSLPYAFEYAGLELTQPVRIEVLGPQWSKWVFGPDDTDQVIKGQAGEWCRVAVQRMSAADAPSLKAQGEIAETALRVARAYM